MQIDSAPLFDTYENQYREISSQISARLKQIQTLAGDNKTRELELINANISEAESILKSMSLSIRSFPNLKENLTTRHRGYETELANFKREVIKAKTTFGSAADRDALFAGVIADDTASQDQKTRLLNDTDTLEKGNEYIRDAKVNANTALDMGTGILGTLDQQREQMMRSRGVLASINNNVEVAGKYVTVIWKRGMQNKFIAGGIIAGLVILIIIIVWVKFFSGGSTPTPTPTPTLTPSPTPSPTPTETQFI